MLSDNHRNYKQQFDDLSSRRQDTAHDVRILQQKPELFILQYQESMKINAQIAQLATQNLDPSMRMRCEEQLKRQKQLTGQQLNHQVVELQNLRYALAQKHFAAVESLEYLKNRIIEELRDWRHKQQRSWYQNENEHGCSIDTIQNWCDILADLICQNRHQLKNAELLRNQLPMNPPSGQEDPLPTLMLESINNILTSLVTESFVVVKQPPQVLKKDSRFITSVRLLVGGKFLNAHLNPPQVRANIVSEAQARNLAVSQPGSNNPHTNSGQILNNTGMMEYNQPTGHLGLVFKNMQLKSIKRADRKGNEAVTDEKFAVLFHTRLQIADEELSFTVSTMSAPVVVTVHGNQECNAQATILWDNAFAEMLRIPFLVPEQVMWPQLAEALDHRFHSATGRGLSDLDQFYLAQRLFRIANDNDVVADYANYSVTWTLFNKDQLPGTNFTFWEWFYNVLKLTKEYLRPHWVDGALVGFISRPNTKECLNNHPDGTFLLRFSESTLGGLSAVFARCPTKPGEQRFWYLEPSTGKDFQILSLADRMRYLAGFDFLMTPYGVVGKDSAFSKYWSKTYAERNDGYVQSLLFVTIPGLEPARLTESCPSVAPPRTMQWPEEIPPVHTPSHSKSDPPRNGTKMDHDIDNVISSMAMDYDVEDIKQIDVSALLL